MNETYQSKCDLCKMKFTSESHYNRHCKTFKHCMLSGDILICNICKKSFVRKHYYDRHVLVHSSNSHSIPVPIDVNDDIIRDKTHDKDIIEKLKNNKHSSQYDKDLEMLRIVYELEQEKHKNEIQKERYERALEVQKERYEKKIYKQKAELYEKRVLVLEKDKEFNQNVIKTAVSGLTYARKYYPNAPELKKLDKYDFGDNAHLIELLLFYARNGKISNYIGDFLIKFYKKNDPNDQSLWSTDISRLTFIVRQILRKKNDWRYDKKGIKVCNTIINPLLDNIKVILRHYVDEINVKVSGKQKDNIIESEAGYDSESEYYKHEKEEELDNNNKLVLVKDQEIAVKIITEIDNKSLAKDIIKYISPHLSLIQTKE